MINNVAPSAHLQLALTDVQSNASIANVIPELAHYLHETVSQWRSVGGVFLWCVRYTIVTLMWDWGSFDVDTSPTHDMPFQYETGRTLSAHYILD